MNSKSHRFSLRARSSRVRPFFGLVDTTGELTEGTAFFFGWEAISILRVTRKARYRIMPWPVLVASGGLTRSNGSSLRLAAYRPTKEASVSGAFSLASSFRGVLPIYSASRCVRLWGSRRRASRLQTIDSHGKPCEKTNREPTRQSSPICGALPGRACRSNSTSPTDLWLSAAWAICGDANLMRQTLFAVCFEHLPRSLRFDVVGILDFERRRPGRKLFRH